MRMVFPDTLTYLRFARAAFLRKADMWPSTLEILLTQCPEWTFSR